MQYKNMQFLVKKKITGILYNIMLVSMLYSSFFASSQNMICDYFNQTKGFKYSGYAKDPLITVIDEHKSQVQAEILNPKQTYNTSLINVSNLHSYIKADKDLTADYVISSDITAGYIGVSKEKPLDDANDNIFKVFLESLPSTTSKVYLTYDLFGAQDFTAVSRSFNDRFSTGGYLVKNLSGWTTQKEEIDVQWLQSGENKIIFGIPRGANYSYQIKNLKIEVVNDKLRELSSLLVVHNPTIKCFKNNQIYLKGFIRNATSDLKVYFEDQLISTNGGEFEGFLTLTEALKKRGFAVVKAFSNNTLLGQEIINLDNLIEADKQFRIDEIEENISAYFKAFSNNELKTDGAGIKSRDSSLTVDKQLSITKLRAIDIAPMGSGMINVTKGELGYRFLPDNTKFYKPVAISIAYDEQLLPKGYTINDIKTFYFNTDSKSWIAVHRDTINKETKEIISLTNHFTDYINGIIQTPESPETAGFTPTMMNDIKAADPAAEMTIISPPQVSQKGEASINYPIKIPAGRKGMQPQLAVQYSNDGGNSWLGQGWNIAVPAIAIDTRWGVPILDPDNETEIYMLNGEQLMYPKFNNFDWMPNRHYDTSTASTIYNTADRPRISDGTAIFTPRKQGSFAKIERIGTGTTEYYWKVTTSDGTINWYGGKDGFVDNSAVIRNSNNSIVHWGLLYTEDVHGNCVRYLYDSQDFPDQSGINANLNGATVFNIKNIFYNGYNDSDYKYQVDFVTNKPSIRQDVNINGRLGVKQIEPYFLNSIGVRKFGDENHIRKYAFKLGYGKFGKGRIDAVSELDTNNNIFYSHQFEYYNDIDQVDGSEIYFNAGIDVTICNDEANPCLDSDGDGVCDDVDECLDEAGPASNDGCPENVRNCYTVSFDAPVSTSPMWYYAAASGIIYGYTPEQPNFIDPALWGNCSPKSFKLKNIQRNGAIFNNDIVTAPNMHLNNGSPLTGYINMCPPYIPAAAWTATSLDPDPSITDLNSGAILKNWIQSSVLNDVPYANLWVKNTSGLRIMPTTLPVTGYPDELFTIGNFILRFYSSWDLDFHFTQALYDPVTNTETSQTGEIYPTSSTPQMIQAGLSTQVSINGVQIQGGPFDLLNDFEAFQLAVTQQLGSGVTFGINLNGSDYTLNVLSNTPYTTLALTYGGQTQNFNFTIIPNCNLGTGFGRPIGKPIVGKFDIPKRNIEHAINKWLAEGAEIDLPYKPLPFVISTPASVKGNRETIYTFTKTETESYWQDSAQHKILDISIINELNALIPLQHLYAEHLTISEANEKEFRLESQKSAKQWLEANYPMSLDMLPQVVSKGTSTKDYGEHFREMGDSYTYTFEGTIPIISNPDCPSFLNYDLSFQEVIPSFDSTLALLGTSVTKADNAGFYVGVGIGCKWYTKSTTFGAQWSWSKDKSTARIALADINGDGLDDIIFHEYDGFLYYKAHQIERTYDENNQPVITHSFTAKKPMTGINNFYNSYGSAKSRNFQITFGITSVGGFVGKDKSSSKATNNVYFTDGNGDGLLDVVKNGVVYFNRLDSNSNPFFDPESENTENMVIIAEPASVTEPVDVDDIIFPNYDVVKVWEAPADGIIRIENTIVNTSATEHSMITIEKQTDSQGLRMVNSMPSFNDVSPNKTRTTAPQIVNAILDNSDYIIKESDRKTQVEAFEKELNLFIESKIDTYALSKQKIDEIKNRDIDTQEGKKVKIGSIGDLIEKTIKSAKAEQLTTAYFQQNPEKLYKYNRLTPPNAQACDNGGFEDGVSDDYNFWIKPQDSDPIFCDFNTSVTNGFYIYNPIPFPPYNIWARIMDMGTNILNPQVDGNLYGFGVSIPVANSGRYALKLNDHIKPYTDNFSAAKMVKSFFLDYIDPHLSTNLNSAITFSFNFICQNPQDHDPEEQPRFIARLYDKDGEKVSEFCLESDVANTLMFKNATTNNIDDPLLYTGWQCASLSTGGIQNLPNQSDREVRLEISVNDCTQGAHYGYAYVDDICTNATSNCANSAYGQLNLDFDNPQLTNCPTFPIFVTGSYTAPHSLNEPFIYPANTPSLVLEILQGNVVVGSSSLPVTVLNNPDQQHSFTFELNASHFGGLSGNYEFRLTGVFSINGVNFTKVVNSARPEVDISFNNCIPDLICNVPAEMCLLFGSILTGGQTINESITTNCTGQPLSVKKGEKIYFRTHSVPNGNPVIDWNPKITYIEGVDPAQIDQNSLKPFENSYNEGFILSRFKPTVFPGNQGTASVTWAPFYVNNPTDDVLYEVYHRTTVGQENSDDDTVSGADIPIYTRTCLANQITEVSPIQILTDIPISNTGASNMTMDDFYFKVTSTSNINWKQYEWKPQIVCTVNTQIIGEENITEGTFTSNETLYPIVDYSIYKDFGCSYGYSLFDTSVINGGVGLSVKPHLNGIFISGDQGTLNFVVKSNGVLLGKRIATVSGSSVTLNDNTPILLNGAGQDIEIGYYLDDSSLFDTEESLLLKLAFAENSTVKIWYNSSANSFDVPNDRVNLFQRPNPKFGPMLRQWGQFLYNPNAVTGAASAGAFGNLIKESTLSYDLTLANNINGAVNNLNENSINENNFDALESTLLNLSNSPLLVATPTKFTDSNNVVLERWVGLHDENYACEFSSRAATMEQSFDGSYDFEGYEYQDILQTGAYSINKLSRGANKNFSGGVSVDIGASVGANASKTLSGDNKSVTEYIDFNGDRYPDLITTDQVQYTKRIGGLFAPRTRSGDITISESASWGVGAQGSFNKGGDDGGSPKGYPKLHVSFEGFKGNAGGGLSMNFSKGRSVSSRVWTDINGDGLADLLEKDSNGQISVGLNYGYSMDNNSYSWNLGNLFNSKSTNISGGGGINKWNGSLEAGVAVTSAWNDSTEKLLDMNGDGLLDYVSSDSDINVSINRGNKFFDLNQSWSNQNFKRESVSVGFNANVTGTGALVWYIPFTNICLKIPALSISKSLWSTTTNKTKKTVVDFDGDGYPDIVEQINGTMVKVYSSKIRRTDMLKAVTNPLGGKFTIDYKVQKVDYNNPNAKWTMSDLLIEDKCDKINDGKDRYVKRFIYEDGKYDRRERDFYGYGTVKAQDYSLDEENAPSPVYRTSVSKYYNQSYFLNGLLKEAFVIKGEDENAIFSRSENFYEIRELNVNNDKITSIVLPDSFDVGGKEGRRTAAVVNVKTVNYFHELSATPLLTSEIVMSYDEKARVNFYVNNGNVDNPADNYYSKISYHDDPALELKNLINIPKSIVVMDETGTVRRKRVTNVDITNGTIQNVEAVSDISNTTSITSMEYDIYGNLNNIKYPENQNGQSMFYHYKYDSDYHKYIVNIIDAFGYSSSAIYDGNFDKPVETTDLTGNKMLYKYDSFGRNIKILGPKEIAAGLDYTIQFAYFPLYLNVIEKGYEDCVSADLFTPFAITDHFDVQHSDIRVSNDIQTITFIDGLARPIQVKKDIQMNLNSPQDPTYREMMSVSGKTTFDDYGRGVQQYHPYFEPKNCQLNFVVNEHDAEFYSRTQLDELDRATLTIDPDEAETYMDYSIAEDADGTMALKTRTTIDQNGNQNIITETYKDVSGKVISTNNIGNTDLWTRFDYNAIGELMSYTDADNIATDYEYDLLGRKTALHHPDNGTTSYTYDKASNLLTLQTANLSANGALDPAERFIKYYYEYNRLEGIEYPVNPDGSSNLSNVGYKFGNSGNETGRLIYQEDATGTQDFQYGNMGEMIYNRRMVVGPNIPTYEYETRFGYDSWNRLQNMQYPDGEKITYNYDLGGSLVKMIGEVNGSPYNYIERIDYDYYEQRAYLLYGNNTETFYEYTPALRQMGSLNVKTSGGSDLFYNKYQYDKVGNVIKLENTSGFTPNGIGGNYDHKFYYDALNRLKDADGSFTGDQISQLAIGNDYSSTYKVGMAYNNTHGIASKNQKHSKNGTVVAPNSYDNYYKYVNGTHKLLQVSDNSGTGMVEDFSYDHNGNLVNKSDNLGNGRSLLWDESNRLRVINEASIMQHYIYDATGERVLKANTDVETVYENGTLINSSVTINGYTSYPSAFIVLSQWGVYSKHYYAGSQRIVSRIGDEDPDIVFATEENLPRLGGTDNFDAAKLQRAQVTDVKRMGEKVDRKKIVFKEYTPFTYEEIEKALDADEDVTKKEEQLTASLQPLYFYHPDHLGTSTGLTDFNGEAYQFFLNLPFGETMAEQMPSTYYKTPYKFTGKELDEETGLYYYGARYYDPRISNWLSIDPLAAHSPNKNPYHYCSNNPVNRTDPTGMCDDSKCTHSGVRQLWDRLGRAIGKWGYSVPRQESGSTGATVTAGPLEVVSESVSFTKFDIKLTLGLQGAVEGEVLNRKAGADINLVAITILRGSYQQQKSDYGPDEFDGIFLTDKNNNGFRYAEINQSISGGMGLLTGGLSREFKGKMNGYEGLEDEYSFGLGPISGSATTNEQNQTTAKKLNIARGKIAFGIGIEFKLSTGTTTEKIKK